MATLTAAGATPVRLGPHVLRTSTAGPVAAAVVLAVTGAWASGGDGSPPPAATRALG